MGLDITVLAVLVLSGDAHAGDAAPASPGWTAERWTPSDGLPITAIRGLARTPDDRLWIAGFEGLASFDGRAFVLAPAEGPSGTPGLRIEAIGTDPEDGALWLLAQGGVVQRRHGGEVQTFPDGTGTERALGAHVASPWRLDGRAVHWGEARVAELPSHVVALLPDGDDAWVATAVPAVYRLRRAALQAVRSPDGTTRLVDRLWWDEAQQRLWARWRGLGWRAADGTAAALEPPGPVGAGDAATPVRVGSALWWRNEDRVLDEAGADVGLGLPPVSEAYAAEPDGEGGAWLGLHESLWHAVGGAWRELRSASGPIPRVRDVAVLADGTTWLASALGPLRVSPGGAALAGPPAGWRGETRHVRVDAEHVWVATEEMGLCALPRGGERWLGSWRCLDAEHGFPRTTVHASLEDHRDRVWISTNRGLGLADAATLLAFAREELDEVPILWLDERDGMSTREANGFMGAGAEVTPDGRLHFATQDGVVTVDPARFTPPPAPTVLFDAGNTELHLEPGAGPLRVAWTAVAFDHAEQVEFRRRLDGGAWSLATPLREAVIEALEPGAHQLEVQARLGGAWGEPATVVIHRPPAWHERQGTRLGLAAGVLGVGLAGAALVARARRRRAAAVEATPATPMAEPAGTVAVGEVESPGPAGILAARLCAVADARLADESFGADELARAMAMSRRTLHRRMAEEGLDSPSHWLLHRRLATAQRLLRDGQCTTVGEAATAVGLSRAYFTRAYTAWCGRPPGEERRAR